jgi:MFS family permease
MVRNILSHYKSSFSGLSRNVWILTLATFINRSGSMVLFFLMLYFTQDLKLSIQQAGVILSFFGVGSMVGTLSGGWLSDKIGTKKVMLNSLISGGFLYIILGYIHDIYLLSIMLVLVAVIAESFRPAIMTALANSCKPQNMTRGFALIRLAINLGVSIGPAVGGFLALYDYIYIFWVEGLTCIFSGIYILFAYHENPVVHTEQNLISKSNVRSPLKDLLYIQLLMILLIVGIVFNQIFNTWPVFLRETYLFTEDHIGLLLGLNAFIIVLVEMPLIHKVEKYSQFRVVAIGSLLLCVGIGMVILDKTFLFVAFTVVILTIGEMLTFPLLSSFIANRGQGAKRGQYMGLMTFTFSLSFVIGPLLGSYILHDFGAEIMWLSVVAAGLIILPGYLVIERMAIKEQLSLNKD